MEKGLKNTLTCMMKYSLWRNDNLCLAGLWSALQADMFVTEISVAARDL